MSRLILYSLEEAARRDRESKRKYAIKNRAKILQYKKRYYKNNKQKWNRYGREYQRQYYKANRTRILYKAKIRSRMPKVRFIEMKSKAKLRGITFDLNFGQFLKFNKKRCYYCNDKLYSISLDRVNNTAGYTLKNVVPCCKVCNIMKQFFTKTQFLSKCKKITNNKGR